MNREQARSLVRGLVASWLIGGALAGCQATLKPARREVGPPTALIGQSVEAHWSATTIEAASTPTHRSVLDRGRSKTIIGEVVDVSCFLQLGKRGEAHIPCGQKCVRNGQPVGVLTNDGELFLIMPEEHHPRRDGQVNLRDRFADLMAKRVQVSGMLTQYKNYRALFVRTLPTEQ